MARIEIDDLSEEEEISEEEMQKVMGGILLQDQGTFMPDRHGPMKSYGTSFGSEGGRFGSGNTFCG